MDALDRRPFKRFTKQQKVQFAKAKSEEEVSNFIKDEKRVIAAAKKFDETVRKQRIALGLKG